MTCSQYHALIVALYKSLVNTYHARVFPDNFGTDSVVEVSTMHLVARCISFEPDSSLHLGLLILVLLL